MTKEERSFWTWLWKFFTTPYKPPKPPTAQPVVVEPAPAPPPAPEPPPPPPPPPPKVMRLFSVGINKYSGAELHGCVNDSLHMVEFLGGKGFEAHQLLDADATGTSMEAFWREGVAKTGPGDLLAVHYSGHGSNGPSGLPTDPAQCLVSVELRPFYASRLGHILDELDPAARAVVFLDCCHSETATRGFLWSRKPKGRPKFIPWEMLNTSLDPVPSEKFHRAFGLKTLARAPEVPMIEFAACQANDVTYDAEINGVVQGDATRAWLDAALELDREKPGGYTVAEFQERVMTKLPSKEFPNQPQLQAASDQRDWRLWVPA